MAQAFRMGIRVAALLAACALAGADAAEVPGAPSGWPWVQPGTVVLLRHANAPGVGDPPGFRLGDCATQRNLDDAGTAQARHIGEQFRSRRIAVSAVLNSQWCRARDTATLAFPGKARDDALFNSFFDDRSRSVAQTAAAMAILSSWRGPGVLVVFTHQVNITALTGVVPASGEGVVLRPGRGGVELLGRLLP